VTVGGELALAGLVALAFGVGSYYATGAFGAFGVVNVAAGALALAGAAFLGLRGWRGFGSPDALRVLAPPLLGLCTALAGSVALERIADARGWSVDLTFERRYELAPATHALLAASAGDLRATLFCEQGDPRCRSSRILLETLAAASGGRLAWAREKLADEPESADRFGITTSNTVVVERGERFAKVERPSEGSLYEAIQRLVAEPAGFLYVARGEGEADLRRTDDVGYSGLAAALETEGYRLRDLVLAATDEIPADAVALLLLAPERELRAGASAALGRWLEGGGRLVVCIDPGPRRGIEALLAGWGLDTPDRLVVDPASGPLAGDPPGVNPIVHQFADHPVARGLGETRMVFFRGARPVMPARKPLPDDDLRAVAFSSRRAWLAPSGAAADGAAPPERPPDAAEDYQPLVATGRYPRLGSEARIVAFGDCDFAANRNLRGLYNQDLALNAVHWAADRTDRITLRPKALPPHQFPLTPQETLRMLYGVGLLVPELLLLAGGIAWLRRRSG
jgi:hypothetical protein